MPQRAKELARWASRNLPPSPGTYVFRDPAGRALYVGKSVSLQRRVRAHFTTSHSFVRQRADMLPRIDRVDWEVTGSELRALLREAELIAELAPVYNVQRQRRASRLLVHVGPADAAVVNTASTVRGESGDDVGPFPTARDARLAAPAARRLLGLPARGASPVEPWRRAAALAYLSSGRAAAIAVVSDADAPAEEREALVRRLRRSRTERRPLAGGLGGERVVVVDSGPLPGDAEIALIDDGQVARHVVLTRPRRSDVRRALQDLLKPRESGESASADHRSIVIAWLHARAGHDEFLAAPCGDPGREFVEQVWERARRAAHS